MSSKNLPIQATRLSRSVRSVLETTKRIIDPEMGAKQWIACMMVCTLLWPVFSLPAAAAVNSSTVEDKIEFEPVNEDLRIWAEVWRDLNAKVEAWATPYREGNSEFAMGDEKGTTDAKEPAKRRHAIGDAAPKRAATEKTTGRGIGGERMNKISLDPKPKEQPIRNPIVPPSAPAINQLPADEQGSVYTYGNNLGSPKGQVEMDSSNAAAALPIRHRAGLADYSFGLPLASLSGRGIDASVGMTYNSRTWNTSCIEYGSNGECVNAHYTYDVEASWIAPGFSSGFGYLESVAVVQRSHQYGSSNFTYYTEIVPRGITDSNGTRHQLSCVSPTLMYGIDGYVCTGYKSNDGTFIKVNGGGWSPNPGNANAPNLLRYDAVRFTAIYSNGSKSMYSGGMGTGADRRQYPLIVQDSNGNRNRISYADQSTGRISGIADTLNRKIKFYYEDDSNGNPDKLVAVTIPGMGTDEEIQTLRFYYDTLTLNSTGKFTGTVTAPATIRVLSHVFMPGTRNGYKYEYDTNYGMIRKITRNVGMTASTASLTETGTVDDGQFAASTEYNYPDGSAALTDVPKYTQRTDDWYGRTGTAQVTDYNIPEPAVAGTFESTITVHDSGFDIVTQNVSGSDGSLKESSVTRVSGGPLGTRLMSKVKYVSWSADRNPTRIEITNDAGLTRAVEFGYDGYGNQTSQRECDYAAPGAACTELRKTETTYRTGAGWTNANILGLPETVTVKVGGVAVAKTELEYDRNGDDSLITPRADIDTGTHDTYYNPAHPAWTERVCPNGDFGVAAEGAIESDPNGCRNIYHPGYNANSAYRGNVTKVTRYSDAAAASAANDPAANITNYNYS